MLIRHSGPPVRAALPSKLFPCVRQPIYGFGGSQTYAGDALAGFANQDAVYKESAFSGPED